MRNVSWVAVILIFFSCSRESDQNYYDDLSKGSIDILNSDEKQILNAVIADRVKISDAIVLIMDSTIHPKWDTGWISESDTFPIAIQIKYDSINTRRNYIGNVNLGIDSDYRYFNWALSDWVSTREWGFWWQDFYSRFPKSSNGILSFSKIAFNDDSNRAVLAIEWVYGNLGADGGFVSLAKINGIWIILVYKNLWVS